MTRLRSIASLMEQASYKPAGPPIYERVNALKGASALFDKTDEPEHYAQREALALDLEEALIDIGIEPEDARKMTEVLI